MSKASELAALLAADMADVDEIAAEMLRLERVNAELVEAHKKIVAIENQYTGADWEEIEQARSISLAALTTATKEQQK